jgi:hypothetical protein
VIRAAWVFTWCLTGVVALLFCFGWILVLDSFRQKP